jgi:SPX domain protein involved in polyphosphate accumulation
MQSELKFLVSERTAVELRRWARMHFSADPHAAVGGSDSYRTRTLYFDTNEFDLFFRRGSQARAKFRIRTYNDGPAVFLERKLKAGTAFQSDARR